MKISNKDDIIKLTLVVYQITDFFPKNEPLRGQIRQKANALLADFICLNPQEKEKLRIEREIEALLAYFSVAEEQNWLNRKNFAILIREYKKMRDDIKNIPSKTGLRTSKTSSEIEKLKSSMEKPLKITRASLTPAARQKKIVQLSKNKGEVSLSELRQLFSQVCPRTLRRDLRTLVGRGILEKERQGKENILFSLKR